MIDFLLHTEVGFYLLNLICLVSGLIIGLYIYSLWLDFGLWKINRPDRKYRIKNKG